ncbi:hypothetical protein L1987_01442 [Smallanthus sonchifolius]|uniref:Uncharacterized protein n=1 Tax=Smallanthus sonchifolius TaxID=185202 RepID=A0ACB9K524_9ASTR|nr:hypothetical protein L1987_01442 [Smallanthus sonchifolius]
MASHAQYDVFLSFRGEDTRHAFTDHLYHALLRVGLCTFRDNDEIDRGQQLKPEIETAIIQSRASIVVLSENYANSIWCLNELWLILEQRRKCGSKGTMDDEWRWKEALREVADLSGMVLSGSLKPEGSI